MYKRRSERIRRKQQTTPGLSRPGAYSAYNDGFVVESEASFLPSSNTERDMAAATAAAKPATTPGSSRRARYATSPHRFTDESPISNENEHQQIELENETSTPQMYLSIQQQPQQYAADGNSDQQQQLQYTRSGEGQTTAETANGLNHTNGLEQKQQSKPSSDEPSTPLEKVRQHRDVLVDRVRASLFDILDSNTRKPVNPSWRPVATPASKANPNANDRKNNRQGSNRQSNINTNSNTHRPFLGSKPLNRIRARQLHDEDTIPSDDEQDGRDEENDPSTNNIISKIRRRLVSPLGIMLLAVFVTFAVIFALENRVSSRRGVPSASSRMITPIFSGTRTVLRVLFRNAWRSSNVPEFQLPSDIITERDLKEVIFPKLMIAAREEAARAANDVVIEGQRTIQAAADKAAALAATAEKQAADSVAALERQQTEMKNKALKIERDEDELQGEKFSQFAERFAADKNLPPDFALASAGGAIVATQPSSLTLWARFARAYAAALVTERRFTPTRPRLPTVMLEPDIYPGNCWVFDGDRGSVTIRLARPVRLTAVTIEHTPRTSAFSIKSALREFSVIGMPVEEESEEVQLAKKLVFDLKLKGSKHLQTFNIDASNIMRAVRVQIDSNHGANFTAIYRIRVHGDEDMSSLESIVDDISDGNGDL